MGAKLKGWSARLAQLESDEKVRVELRTAIQKAAGYTDLLLNCAGEAKRAGLLEEELLAKAMIAKATKEQRNVASKGQALLDAIASAAASGDLHAAALARDAARDAGLSKKEISRAFALGNSA